MSDEEITVNFNEDDDGDDEKSPRKKHRKQADEDYIQDLFAYKQKHGNYALLCQQDERLYHWILNVLGGRIRLTNDQHKRLDGVGLLLVETEQEKENRLWNGSFEKFAMGYTVQDASPM
jgi:hypothetical protein